MKVANKMTADVVAQPFVKWAGGKRQLLPELRKHVPDIFGRYHEPFVGGGAMFFDLASRGYLRTFDPFMSDVNATLAATYNAVKNDVGAVIRRLKLAESKHSKNHYYLVRQMGFVCSDAATVAARFIYLNKTCFNGLWRVNLKGDFNVPMDTSSIGRKILDGDNLRLCAKALEGVEIRCEPYWSSLKVVKQGDFVYCDPPYAPVSATANFTGYAKGGFTAEDQEKLRDEAVRLKRLGARVLLSNSDAPLIRKLYAKGFEKRSVDARRAINSKASKRGAVGELLIW